MPLRLTEEWHKVDVAGRAVRLRALCADGHASKARHLLITGYTLAAEIYIPYCEQLVRAGHSVRVLDPFTLYDLDERSAASLVAESPESFMPQAYAQRILEILAHMPSGGLHVWAESMGAHAMLLALARRPEIAANLVLMNPTGIRQNLGRYRGAPDRMLTRLLGNRSVLVACSRMLFGSQFREWAYDTARSLVGDMAYRSVYLDQCRTVVTGQASTFYSAMVLPLVGVNQDLVTAESIQQIRGVPLTMVLSKDDPMLVSHTDEDGRAIADYRQAWLDLVSTLEPKVYWVTGGHEAVFREHFDVPDLVATVLGNCGENSV